MTLRRAVPETLAVLAMAVVLAMSANPARAQTATPTSPVFRQALSDAWWTGPLLANGAATLPRGHMLIEPYVYDIASANSSSYGSRAYVFYGLVNGLTVGLIPIVGYNTVSGGPSSSSLGIGDFSFLAQRRITQYHEGRWIPTTGLMVQEAFPTGKYDRLGNRPADGLGQGAYTTTLALNTQWYFWMPTGRILRMRFNVSQSFSSTANVQDVSVYGTTAGFRGHAKPGNSSFADAAWEYSLTRRWVLALDATYTYNSNTRVTGINILNSNRVQDSNSGSSGAFAFAPAIEYNWKSNLGVIFGARIIELGHNTTGSIAPVMAINFVH